MGLSPAELVAWVAKSRQEQGLPPKVVDPVAVQRVSERLGVRVSVVAERMAS